MPKNKKQKDFLKPKLKVGKKKPESTNSTSTSFQTKTLVLQSQHKQPQLSSYLALTRHHQGPTRRQALANISDILHFHEQQIGEILRSVAPLMIDQDHQVRIGLLNFLQKLMVKQLIPHISLLIVHLHAAMTHITAGIRADSTRFLDILMTKCPLELVRQGFTKTLVLFFPLMGWPLKGNAHTSTISTQLSLGKLAPAARSLHLRTLQSMLTHAFKPEPVPSRLSFHPDSEKFLIPVVGNPFDTNVTDDVEARLEAFGNYKAPMLNGLVSMSKEGGEVGRIASKLISEFA